MVGVAGLDRAASWQVGEFGPGEPGMVDQPVEQLVGVGAFQVLEQEEMPVRESTGVLFAGIVGAHAVHLVVGESDPILHMGPSGGYPSLSFLLGSGRIGLTLVMLGIYLAELPSGNRSRDREQTPA